MEVATISPRDLAGKRQNGEPVDQHVAGVLVVGEGDDAGSRSGIRIASRSASRHMRWFIL